MDAILFAETLIEVVDQRSVEQVIDGVAANGPIDATVALCHSIAADIMQADARAYTVASRVPDVTDLEEMFAEASPEVQVDVAITDAIAA